jgi:glycosyltransferase involved in cell wall biosynthesis
MGKRILVLATAAYGERMSSPGIRAHHMARVLVERVPGASVTLAVPADSVHGKTQNAPCRVVHLHTKLSTIREMANHDIIIATGFPGYALVFFPWKTFVLDLFTQYLLEWMEASEDDPAFLNPVYRRAWLSQSRKRLNIHLTFADFVLAASDRQRDAHLGSMMSLGLISPRACRKDPSLRKLVDVAPHGVRPDPLEHTKQVVKGRYAGIRETDKLILWNGGIINWYDPATLIRALAELSRERDDVKLLFLGSFYPGLGALGLGKRFREAVELSRELGLNHRNVFFDVGWIPYEEMKNYTLEADISVCTYFEGLETNFSLRTRFLDIFWAEVPLICTRGDVLAELVEERRLGLTVKEGDVAGVADAIRRLVDDREYYDECKRNIHAIKKAMAWEVALDPLIKFCNAGESIAKPKSERMGLLISRIVGHEVTRRIRTLRRLLLKV